MRIAVAGGFVAVAAAIVGGIVLTKKGIVPMPTVLADVITGRPAVAAAPPAPQKPVAVKPPADPVSTVSSAEPPSTDAQGAGTAPTSVAKPAALAEAAPPAAIAQAAPPTVLAQAAPPAAFAQAAAPAATPAPTPAPATPPTPAVKCDNPNALGVSRVVQIDTTGGPGFGFEHFKTHDFLRPKEVVLTFDDGPWPVNTPNVLAALAAECVKATFFPIGEHATWHPEILRQVAAAGHTIGSHTWSHKDLSKLSLDDAKTELEKGISAVRWALGAPEASFVRFPALRHPPEVVAYVGTRNLAIFSTDIDSFDFKVHKPEQVIKNVIGRLNKLGKGIVLMHDFQRGTGIAMPELLRQLKANGYHIVQMKAKAPVETLQAYDDEVAKALGGPGMSAAESARPTKDIVETISGQ